MLLWSFAQQVQLATSNRDGVFHPSAPASATSEVKQASWRTTHPFVRCQLCSTRFFPDNWQDQNDTRDFLAVLKNSWYSCPHPHVITGSAPCLQESEQDEVILSVSTFNKAETLQFRCQRSETRPGVLSTNATFTLCVCVCVKKDSDPRAFFLASLQLSLFLLVGPHTSLIPLSTLLVSVERAVN